MTLQMTKLIAKSKKKKNNEHLKMGRGSIDKNVIIITFVKEENFKRVKLV